MTDERILVVEAEPGLLNKMSLALRRRGYQVEQAEDGCSALDILGSQPPFSVLLTSLDLPGDISGLDLLRAVRKIDEFLQVVVAAPASEPEPVIAALHAEGTYSFLTKPSDSMIPMLLVVERAAAHHCLVLERNNLLKRLQRETSLQRILTTSTGDAVLAANSAGVLQITNQPAARLLGANNAEGRLAQNCLPSALTGLIADWQAVGAGQPAVVELPWPNGSVQLVSLNAIQEINGDSQGWVAVLRDITHLKHLAELKTRVLSETASRICAPLSQAMNTLVELNILTSRNERVNELVYRLTQTWKRVQEWSNDLNALIHIDSKSAIQQTNIDLQPVLQDLVLSQCEPAAKMAGLHVHTQIDPDLPEICTDPDLLHRLLYGLVNRAVERSERGGTLGLKARSHNNQVWISISDDGPAVSDADLPHMFEHSFVQTNNRTTGLEMALVKAITDRMEGQVWVGGQEKKGSTIFVLLPAA